MLLRSDVVKGFNSIFRMFFAAIEARLTEDLNVYLIVKVHCLCSVLEVPSSKTF